MFVHWWWGYQWLGIVLLFLFLCFFLCSYISAKMCVCAPMVGFLMIRNCNNGRIAWLAIFLAHRQQTPWFRFFFVKWNHLINLDCVSHYTKLRVLYSVDCFWTKGYCVVLTRIDSWRPRILSHWQFNDSLALEPINKYTFFLRLLLLGSVCVCFKTKSNPCVWSKSVCSLQHFCVQKSSIW